MTQRLIVHAITPISPNKLKFSIGKGLPKVSSVLRSVSRMAFFSNDSLMIRKRCFSSKFWGIASTGSCGYRCFSVNFPVLIAADLRAASPRARLPRDFATRGHVTDKLPEQFPTGCELKIRNFPALSLHQWQPSTATSFAETKNSDFQPPRFPTSCL